ncbi:MAG: 4-(cytidine 5'-diphospho)-2-C-methyl-D-erythritol kinase [Terracidiphilus sp.]|nr:4-(cytidine 5'-diphospho)-2-C-methyl-D-erythritol kinase [Terracidiphilus sp.]
MPTRVRSHAKINLGLYLGAPRLDGFHALTTVYQTLEMHDIVTVTARAAAETAIRLTSNDARVPTDARNTAWKIVSLALDEMGAKAEVDIHIEKRLPVQGGLGAGSANAVAALVGLEEELRGQGSGDREQGGLAAGGGVLSRVRTHGPGAPMFVLGEEPEKQVLRFAQNDTCKEEVVLSPVPEGEGPGAPVFGGADWGARRLEIAARVGSDVPLFLIGGASLGVDRGQEVYPLPDFEAVWCVVAVPAVGVSTPQAFRDWDAVCAREGLTAEASTSKLNELSRAYASAFAGGILRGEGEAGSSGVLSVGKDLAGRQESELVRTGILSWISNDFERVVFPQHPFLSEIKRLLAASDTPEAALHASLSGSGSALFGLYATREAAEAAVSRLRQPVEGVRVETTLTRTLPRAAYWEQMLSQGSF